MHAAVTTFSTLSLQLALSPRALSLCAYTHTLRNAIVCKCPQCRPCRAHSRPFVDNVDPLIAHTHIHTAIKTEAEVPDLIALVFSSSWYTFASHPNESFFCTISRAGAAMTESCAIVIFRIYRDIMSFSVPTAFFPLFSAEKIRVADASDIYLNYFALTIYDCRALRRTISVEIYITGEIIIYPMKCVI